MNQLFALVFSLFCSLVLANQTEPPFPKVDNNVPYSKVATLSYRSADKKITYGSDPSQFALLWRARFSQDSKQKPLVVVIHGGCWLSAYDIQHTYPLSSALVQAGFNVWSLEYRRTGETGGGWPHTLEDIKAGILASGEFNKGEFDLANTVLVGHSAGGHLALLAGGLFPDLKGVIGLAAITDIEAYAMGTNSCQRVTKEFMQGMPQDKPNEYLAANPSKQPLHGNTVLLQGDKDTIVPPDKLPQIQGKQVTLEGVGHFDWIHPGSQAFNELIQQLRLISK